MSKRAWYKGTIVCILLLPFLNCQAKSLWELAQENQDVLRIATLFTAQNVRDHLSDEEGLNDAMDWCKKTGVTHVFIETFRSNYTVEKGVLEQSRNRFRKAGFSVSGCVTTTKVGKQSTGWDLIDCYTDIPTQQKLQEIFVYTASLFDEIMIDDFLFTDCQCDACKDARSQQRWADYRCKLMADVSRQRILAPARAVNPRVKIIIKYPQWYDNFHNRGYDVVRQTVDFDRIWVGTETRDYEDDRWGGKVQYEAYYIMRWLGEIGGSKTGGGWFDPYGTHEDTYVEQARQTVLAGARELVLFCYGSLLRDTGPANVEKLRTEIPGLFQLAKLVRHEPPKGIAAPKPPNSDAFQEQYVYDFVGMLGIPLVPTAMVDTDALAAFLPVHAMKDSHLAEKLKTMLNAGKPLLITDGLAKKLPPSTTENKGMTILKVNGNPKSLLELTRQELRPIRGKLMAPLGLKFDAPNKVALYLMGDDCVVVENFNDQTITATLEFTESIQAKKALVLPIDGEVRLSCASGRLQFHKITPRTLVALTY